MSNRSALELIKDYSAIAVGAATAFYVCGYLIHVAYFRLLGVEIDGQPLDYIKMAGDYSISLFASILQLLKPSVFSQYRYRLVQSPLIGATTSCILAGVLLVLVRTVRWPKVNALCRGLASVCIGVCFTILVSSTLDVLAVKNVLQPIDPAEIQRRRVLAVEASHPLNESVEMVKSLYDDHMSNSSDTKEFREWYEWFNPRSNMSAARQRENTYLSLLLLNLILLVAGIMQWILTRGYSGYLPQFIRSVGVVVFVGQLFLFPLVYATVGRVFTFPISSIKLKDVPKESDGTQPKVAAEQKYIVTNPVYIVAQNEKELVVYDRLNLFQIKHIPRSQIVQIDKLFNASPFEGCELTQDKFVPCEALWIRKESVIVDF